MNVAKRGLPPPPIPYLKERLNLAHLEVEWLAGDGSDRCYYRIRSSQLEDSLVLMQLSESDAVLLRESRYPWIIIQKFLKPSAIRVPALLHELTEFSALVIEDYGDITFESRVRGLLSRHDWSEIKAAYRHCFEVCSTMLGQERSPVWDYRGFDAKQLLWELNFFCENFLRPVFRLNEAELSIFTKESLDVATFLSRFSEYFVHRDFHSRNIMVQGSQLAIIDFQDARLGQASYDLVSLIFDSYVPLDNNQRSELLSVAKVVLQPTHPKAWCDIEETWPAMLLQRQLKAIGTFGFLTWKKKRGDYLQYLPKALETLTHLSVSDARWPWLSQEFPQMLREKLRVGLDYVD